MTENGTPKNSAVPWFGARKFAMALVSEKQALLAQLDKMGALTILELEQKRASLEAEIASQSAKISRERTGAAAELQRLGNELNKARQAIVATEDIALLQEAGVYAYQHPLSDVVAYEARLATIQSDISAMTKKDGGAVLATTSWTVNGSEAQGRAMVRDISKLMLRAFNAEADNLVRGLKPYKLKGAIERLSKVAETIARLGKSMSISISRPYFHLRTLELELTADYLQKQAEQKESEREEKERLREERKVQQEIERERAKLAKERQHYENALAALVAKGDDVGAARLQEQLNDVDKAIQDVDYRAANIRAGYVYVISNVGSFGEQMVKVGMTRRLDPLDRIRELSDASVPFNFDVHAIFFSKDAVGIETAMHARLSQSRINLVNRRREFFRITPEIAKTHLSELVGELLHFEDEPEALEYRQSLKLAVGAMTTPPQSAP